jgi:hypothetical protein
MKKNNMLGNDEEEKNILVFFHFDPLEPIVFHVSPFSFATSPLFIELMFLLML